MTMETLLLSEIHFRFLQKEAFIAKMPATLSAILMKEKPPTLVARTL